MEMKEIYDTFSFVFSCMSTCYKKSVAPLELNVLFRRVGTFTILPPLRGYIKVQEVQKNEKNRSVVRIPFGTSIRPVFLLLLVR